MVNDNMCVSQGAGRARILLVASLFFGCAVDDDLDRSRSFVSEYYADVAIGNVDEVMTSYADEFYQHITEDKWRADLAKLYALAGALQKFEVTGIQSRVMVRADTLVTAYVNVEYQNTTTIEKLTIRMVDIPVLVGHSVKFVDSDGNVIAVE